jgi:short subunit dehydrogenase-like uncharacterized protein
VSWWAPATLAPRCACGWADQGDPGNRATTKMVCTAALTLLQDPEGLPGGVQGGGVLTPASGLGQVFVERLRAAGMTLEVTG